MRKLTSEEIEGFASRSGVKRIAVENFLMSMGTDSFNATNNMCQDALVYHWNGKTTQAIMAGIQLAEKGG